MQFKQIIALALFGTAMASPIQGVADAVGGSQDLPTIQAAFSAVEGALNTLDAAIKGLQTGAAASATQDVITKANAVKAALDDGTTKIGASTPISLTESLTVQAASTKLTSLTSTVVNDLISKKDILTAAGQAKVTLDSLQSQKSSSEAFVKSITGKVPSGVQSIAAAASKSVGDSLAKGIAAFGGSAKRSLFPMSD